ncbi:DUF4286 family protein [Lysobacter cavernae]|uniref:DUF4286 family protein n=1 Tax=Lysobacter cavernae TaxID=1685901 RepID=A0ABV7RPJ3_9GAMM
MSAAEAAGVIYEVNLDLDAVIRAEYLAWLDAHVREICALPGFVAATVFDVLDPAAEPGHERLCVQYTLSDAAALDAYLREHAPRMRAEGVARFGERFRASRRVLQPRQTV